MPWFFLLISPLLENRVVETRSDHSKIIRRRYQSETRALGSLSEALQNTNLYTRFIFTNKILIKYLLRKASRFLELSLWWALILLFPLNLALNKYCYHWSHLYTHWHSLFLSFAFFKISTGRRLKHEKETSIPTDKDSFADSSYVKRFIFNINEAKICEENAKLLSKRRWRD